MILWWNSALLKIFTFLEKGNPCRWRAQKKITRILNIRRSQKLWLRSMTFEVIKVVFQESKLINGHRVMIQLDVCMSKTALYLPEMLSALWYGFLVKLCSDWVGYGCLFKQSYWCATKLFGYQNRVIYKCMRMPNEQTLTCLAFVRMQAGCLEMLKILTSFWFLCDKKYTGGYFGT